jgi:hypothetical protein
LTLTRQNDLKTPKKFKNWRNNGATVMPNDLSLVRTCTPSNHSVVLLALINFPCRAKTPHFSPIVISYHRSPQRHLATTHLSINSATKYYNQWWTSTFPLIVLIYPTDVYKYLGSSGILIRFNHHKFIQDIQQFIQ